MSARESDVVVDGVRSPVLEAGPADSSEAVVFVHGNPGSGLDWKDLVPRVGEFGRAVAPDMPGFGRADKPRSFDYTVGGYAKHLAALLDQLGVARAHVVVHDFGGPWALLWGAMHPDAYRSTTLVNTGIFPGYRWHRMARRWRTPVLGELMQALTTRRLWFSNFRREPPGGLPDWFIDQMWRQYDRRTRRAVLKLYRATDDPGKTAAALRDTFRPLDRPTLVVWGRHDPYVKVDQAERQRESFPSAEVVVLDGSGHWPMITEPERVADVVIPFLRAQLAGASAHA